MTWPRYSTEQMLLASPSIGRRPMWVVPWRARSRRTGSKLPHRALTRSIWLGLALLLAPAASAQPAPEWAAQAREIVADPSYQKELPGLDGAPADSGNTATGFRSRSWRLPLPAAASSVFTGFAWVLLGALVLAALFGLAVLVYTAVSPRFEDQTDDGAEPVGEAPDGDAFSFDQDPRDLETLVAAGAWAAACHRLLRRALTLLNEGDRRGWPASMTSREILARTRTDAARRPLTLLVAAVEQSRFAGLPIDAAEYQRCAEAFELLRRQVSPV